ncbi:UDP-N-acetylmuramoyl-L-alanyl-D-glutamate--2,6-diaminopimelate ligase [Oceanithermus profundus]
MTLRELFAPFGLAAPDLEVRGVTHDSRRVEPGFVYVALPGRRFDGHAFVADAVARGAVAVAGARALSPGVPYLRLPESELRPALARLAAEFHGRPSEKLWVAGVTGTDGKTTTTFLLHHLLAAGGRRTGMIGTVGYDVGAGLAFPEGHFTTPEAPEVQGLLTQMVEGGFTHAVLEASSHALAQHRLDAVDFDLAVWTHLSPEHLDFHGDMEGYFRAKALLVERARLAVLNTACPYAMRLMHRPHLSYGPGGEFELLEVHEEAAGLAFAFSSPEGRFETRLPMLGRYNAENALAALAAAYTAGVSPERAAAELPRFAGVPGRMQIVRTEPFRVVVDFAHTPKGLAATLSALRPTTEGRLVVVVGSAGERDPGKRAPLGRAAVELADLAVFTEEDSRSEPVEEILAELARGAEEAGGREGKDYLLEPDRARAIALALELARPGDTVVLAGKGHERTLERENETLPWNEAALARRLLGLE